DGWFVFSDLPAGRLSLNATTPGYTGGAYKQTRPGGSSQPLVLTDGERLGDGALKRWKQASITGTVTDETGEPVVGVFVRVLRRTIVGGRPVLQMSGAGRSTDDRGVYRAFDITPGDYVVCLPATQTTIPVASLDGGQPNGATTTTGPDGSTVVVITGGPGVPFVGGSGERLGDLILQGGGMGGRGQAVSPPTSDTGAVLVYQTTFFPAATVSSRAETITLKSGEARTGVDLQVTPVPTMRVSGTIVGPEGPAQGVGLHLITADPDLGLSMDTSPDDVATTISDPRGQFTFLGVPHGEYVLQAVRNARRTFTLDASGSILNPGAAPPTDPTLWAAAAVSVDRSDVTGLSVVLQPGLQVTGRLVFEGASSQPDVTQLQRPNVVRLAPLQTGAGRGGGPVFQATTVSPSGSFVSSGYEPGRYSVVALTWPALKWIVKGISVAGADVSDVPLEIGAADISNLTITYTDQPAHLTGTVRDASGAADATATVVVFPPDRKAWGWPNGLHTKSANASSTGAFSLTLPPGDYEVAAVPDEWQSGWQDPSFLERLLPLATRIQLKEAETRTEDVKTVQIR
ncbi:MAG TPA: carboxypeptidase-like regulatory domain-containing protein, partial [Vicinamibacterales bacterium]